MSLSAHRNNYNNVLLTAGRIFGYGCPESVSGNNHAEEKSFRITLTDEEAQALKRRAQKYTLPYFQVQRAQMILLAAQGLQNDEIAARLNTRREVVSQWRKRFFHERLPGLEERPRPGRPRASPPNGIYLGGAVFYFPGSCHKPLIHG